MHALVEAATNYKQHLEGGEPTDRPVIGKQGTVPCLKFMPESDVAELRRLRSLLWNAMQEALSDPEFALAAEKLACHPTMFQAEQSINHDCIHTRDPETDELVPFVEFVHVKHVETIGRAIASLGSSVTASDQTPRIKKKEQKKQPNDELPISPQEKNVHELLSKGWTPKQIGKPKTEGGLGIKKSQVSQLNNSYKRKVARIEKLARGRSVKAKKQSHDGMPDPTAPDPSDLPDE